MSAGIIFMGTPDYAVPALQELIRTYTVLAVVTQPDRPAGRGRKLIASPVKETAQQAGLPVLQPETLRPEHVVAQLRELNPDLIVVAAFGQILRADVLAMPPLGCINLHASLLPRWRGAAPVAAAVKAGDPQTGVTLMQMDAGLDTGPVISTRAMPVSPTHTRATLTADLARLGASLLIDTLPDWLAQKITPQPQPQIGITYAPRIKKAEGELNWKQSAAQIEQHIRAFDPWPGTFSYWNNTPFKIRGAATGPLASAAMAPGTVFRQEKNIAVATGSGSLILQTVQPAGKRAMPATDFARGAPDFVGSILQSLPPTEK